MHILLDAYWWDSGPASLSLVVKEQVRAWAATFPEDRISIMVRGRDMAAVGREAPTGVHLIPTRSWPQAVASSLRIESLAQGIGADGVLAHNYAGVRGGTGVFIHDFLFIRHPDWFTQTERLYFSMMPRLLSRAKFVIVSSSSEGEAIRNTVSNLPRLAVAPLAPSVDNLELEPARPPLAVQPGGFLLTVGRLNARKNLAKVINGALSSSAITRDFPLVIVGAPDGKWHLSAPELDRPHSGRIIFTGALPQSQVNWLYRHCAGFLCLSLGEGFGLPPLEARALSPSPIVLSDIPIFRETMGDDAYYVDPTSVERISEAIEALPGQRTLNCHSIETQLSLARNVWSAHVRTIRASMIENCETLT